ncbi:MAG: hypothetical protein CMO40_08570 [Verrucomicrobiaceae bacterium]|nr:hypothetical protein [Verrucomicrobiaceae bacterium]
MKVITRIGVLCGIGAGFVGAVEPGRPAGGNATSKHIEVRSLPTHEQILELQRPRNPELRDKTVRLADLQRPQLKKSAEQSAEAAKRRESLVKRSTIVSGVAGWTIVPRGSVLSTPTRFTKRINGTRNGKLVSWRDFYAKNSSWIRLLPVTIEQATGQNPLTEQYMDSLKNTGLLVVAVCEGGPISVRLPVDGEEAPRLSKPVKAAEWKSPSRR